MIKKVLYFMAVILVFFIVSGCDVFNPPPVYGLFTAWENVLTMIEPADLDAYESLLPGHLTMPEKPKVILGAVNYHGVRIPLRPYYEVFIALTAKEPFEQREGAFILTMPVTKLMAEWGGIMLGFPKYIAEDITLEPDEGHDLVGELIHEGRSMIKMTFDGYGHEMNDVFGYSQEKIKEVLKDKYSLYDPTMGPADYELFDFLILLSDPQYFIYPAAEATPPGTKTTLKMARFNYEPHKVYTREAGFITITTDPNDPWGALFSPTGTTEAVGFRTTWKGKADLLNVN